MGKRFKRLVEVVNKPHLFGALRQQEEDEEDWEPSKEAVKEARGLIFTEEDYAETRCGFGSFSPQWLQVLARKEAYLAVYCMVGLVQGMFFSYTVSVISTLEKRFKLTSKQTGTILCGNDISQVILAMVLGYYGNYGHRPRWVGVGVFCTAISCFLAALPHLLYGPGQDALDLVAAMNAHRDNTLENSTIRVKKMEVCHSYSGEACEEGEDGLLQSGSSEYIGPIILFFVSQFFVGISISLFYSIGLTYLDDNVNKKTYPLYYSMSLLLRILGPVLGYLVGGRCLSMWIDPTQSPNLNLRDPRWLGAWWLGFVFLGCALTCVGSLLFLFPRRLPGTLTREAKRVARLAEKEKAQEAAAAERGEERKGETRGLEYFASLAKVKKQEEEKPTLSNLRVALGRLFRNKLWLGNLFNTVVVVFAYSGYWNFKPKYLENQFRRSAAEATYYTGVVSLASVLMGTVMGGVIMRWVRPRPHFVAAYNVFITLFVSAGFLGLMFLGCPKLDVVGPMEGSPVPPCSLDCGCSERFSPMCSEDNVTLFYSACYAACSSVDTFANPVVFSGCGCIDNSTSTISTLDSYASSTWPSSHPVSPVQGEMFAREGGGDGFGVSGYCPEQCERPFYYYLITQIIIKTISSTGRVGSSVLLIRSVADKDKGLALGTLTVFMSLFAFIPAPITIGAIIDSSCLVWDTSCGRTGNCWLYDSDKFRTILHLVPAMVVLLSVLGDLVVLWYSRKMDLYGERDNLELEVTPPTTPTTPITPDTPSAPLLNSPPQLTQPLPDNLNNNSHPHSLPHSRPHSRTHSLTHSLTQSRTHSRNPSQESVPLCPPPEYDYVDS
ncbi:solute carrier organic anion transporter family member 74D-like [Portunus trituberculatus]|uniref:solute carrier organic anion transporter family member 74D-like n=1 Tax=Portunus trituberculatus TaxID=210409 RepID=UPI001E1D065D|nr:solute carrier organic anion transporter family member 74D-like [Portunus trituberculatus]XP_045122957.1 solute carrier organic anion transporter family member 74D-like [Portunus trituberculatus]XP_045122959.1 solute carrier organic anion transporter family member 74D-like [Portunus trituberculatus]